MLAWINESVRESADYSDVCRSLSVEWTNPSKFVPQDIKKLRAEIRAARNSVDEQTRTVWSKRISDTVLGLHAYQSSTKIGAFLAFDGEADPMQLMRSAIEQGKQVFVPMIIGKDLPLRFAPWHPEAEMKPNRFGILEPTIERSKWIAGDQLDFVVTPLVGFDQRCNRIGVGGGFYDRTFSFLNDNSKGDLGEEGAGDFKSASRLERAVVLCGFAFELQKFETIESQPWDVRLDCVATESATYS